VFDLKGERRWKVRKGERRWKVREDGQSFSLTIFFASPHAVNKSFSVQAGAHNTNNKKSNGMDETSTVTKVSKDTFNTLGNSHYLKGHSRKCETLPREVQQVDNALCGAWAQIAELRYLPKVKSRFFCLI